MLNRVPYLDYYRRRCAYWPAYGRVFNMLNERRLMSSGWVPFFVRGGMDAEARPTGVNDFPDLERAKEE